MNYTPTKVIGFLTDILYKILTLLIVGLAICVVTGKTGIADYLLVFVLEVSNGVAIQFFSDWLTDELHTD